MVKELRALIVEDDPSWQQLLAELLNDCGLAVDCVESYDQAITVIRSVPHRMAVLDLSLGGLDHLNQEGLRVLEAVRHQDPGCAAIFLTGFATVELAVNVIQEYGAYTCLRKETFRRAEFRKLVNRILAAVPGEVDSGEPENLSRPGGENPGGTALIVEDDAGWRSLLAELLGDAGYLIHQSVSYIEALGLLWRFRFDLAVIDLSLASSYKMETNQDGYRLLASMQKASIPTIVVSGYADPTQIEKAYTAHQLFACLEKQGFDRKLFLETVRQVRSTANPVIYSLTGRERQVLALIAQGLTNKEIGQTLYITPNTVKRHLKSLFAKLGVSTRSAASAKAVQSGLGEQ